MSEDTFTALVVIVFAVLLLMTFWKQVLVFAAMSMVVVFVLGLYLIGSNLPM